MQLLIYMGETIQLVNEALRFFIEAKKENDQFINPFILCMNKNEPVMMELDEFTEPCVKAMLEAFGSPVHGFVLAGETQLPNPKTGTNHHFLVVKLMIEGLEHSYVYSLPFLPDNAIDKQIQATFRFAGTEPNTYFPFDPMAGEESSCNALKMDNEAPYDYRAAFLIGHFDEERLWKDTEKLVADTYCKLAIDTQHQYEFIFEVSKFGRMTDTMHQRFEQFNSFFQKEVAHKVSHIKGTFRLENIQTPMSEN